MGVMRPLLPYEILLCRELGITVEEYQLFLKYQDKTAKPIPDGEIVAGPLQIALLAVGLLFNVVGALFKPQPRKPEQRKDLNESFSPTFGFNSVQELARYGETVPLIYTNKSDNPNGGIRVNTRLIWSAVEAYGDNQLGRFLGLLGAGTIGAINSDNAAIGDTLLRQAGRSRYWIYYQNGDTTSNKPRWQDVDSSQFPDPSVDISVPANLAYRLRTPTGLVEGYSQALQPATATKCGIYDFIGINLEVYDIQQDNTFSSNVVTTSLFNEKSYYFPGDTIYYYLPKVTSGEDGIEGIINKMRRQFASKLTYGSRYKLGAATFELVGITGAGNNPVDIENYDVVAQFQCIREGAASTLNSRTFNGRSPRDSHIVKAEFARYRTSNQCDIVDLNFRVQLWRRVSGTKQQGVNGYRDRALVLRLRIRESGGEWVNCPRYILMRDRRPVDTFQFIKLILPSGFNPAIPRKAYEIELEPCFDLLRENGGNNILPCIELDGRNAYQGLITINMTVGGNTLQIAYAGAMPDVPIDVGFNDWGYLSATELGLEDVGLNQIRLFDPGNYESYSGESGTECQITVVTEQQIPTTPIATYPYLSLVGINLYAGQSLSDLQALSIEVTQGKVLRRLTDSGYPFNPDGASSYFPDIFLDTLLDNINGMAEFIPIESVDIDSLILAKKYCVANQFYWDGVIGEVTNWREWVKNNATTSLLDFGIIDGKFALFPALPYNPTTYVINQNQPVSVSGFFNDGNILEESYKEEWLPTEDTQTFKLFISWRDNSDTFPIKRTIGIRFAGVEYDSDPEDSLDLSDTITNRSQVIRVAQFILNSRKYSDRAIEFQTVPDGMPLQPGSLIWVQTSLTEWQNLTTGIVMADGRLNSPGLPTDYTAFNLSILVYRSGMAQPETLLNQTVNNGIWDATYGGSLFVLGNNISQKRCFKIQEIAYNEEGIATIKALLFPLDSNQYSIIAQTSGFTLLE